MSISLRLGSFSKPYYGCRWECGGTVVTVFSYIPVFTNKLFDIWVAGVVSGYHYRGVCNVFSFDC